MSIAPADRLAELEHQMRFVNGVIVRLNKPFAHYSTTDLFVVTGNNTKTVSITKLGGEGGRYARVPHRGLTIVPIDEVLGSRQAQPV